MASRNQLIGFSAGADEETEEVKPEVQKLAPAWRFHEICPKGKVVKTDKELAELDAAGWKDHPGKIKLLVGHEKIWQEENVKIEDMKPKTKRSKIDHSDKKD